MSNVCDLIRLCWPFVATRSATWPFRSIGAPRTMCSTDRQWCRVYWTCNGQQQKMALLRWRVRWSIREVMRRCCGTILSELQLYTLCETNCLETVGSRTSNCLCEVDMCHNWVHFWSFDTIFRLLRLNRAYSRMHDCACPQFTAIIYLFFAIGSRFYRFAHW